MNLVIRRVLSTEWEDYKNLRIDALKLAPDAFGAKYSDAVFTPDEEWQSRVERFANSADACCFIAWVDGKASGMATVIIENEPTMYQMWLDQSLRKQGIAEKLVLSLKAWVEELGFSTIQCAVLKKNNLAALNLYLRLGFEVTNEDEELVSLKWSFRF